MRITIIVRRTLSRKNSNERSNCLGCAGMLSNIEYISRGWWGFWKLKEGYHNEGMKERFLPATGLRRMRSTRIIGSGRLSIGHLETHCQNSAR